MEALAVADPHKKTHISQLLNPTSTVSYSEHTAHLHHSHQSYPSPYTAAGNYELPPNGWNINQVAEMPGSGRKPGEFVAARRPYQQSQLNGPSNVYENQGIPRTIRPANYETSHHVLENSMWQQQQQPPPELSMPYNAPIMTQNYSDERTAISGGYSNQSSNSEPPSNAYNYDNSMFGRHDYYQQAERASVRVAARNSTPTQSQSSWNSGYPDSRSGFNSNSYDSTVYQSQELEPTPPNPQPSRKRNTPSSQSESELSKAKKAKKKATDDPSASGTSRAPPATSKRGYHQKKRNETAQLQAQNAHLIPTVSYISGKGKERASDDRMRMVPDDGSDGFSVAKLTPELQSARCMSNKYRNEDFPRCVSCTRRWAGDTCRFQGIRFFLKDENKEMVGVSFVNNQKAEKPAMHFPSIWNTLLTAEHILKTKRVTARHLLPILRRERQHVDTHEIIYRPRECEVRATCDTCMTSLFCSSWMCRLCGREACAECFEDVKELTVEKPGATQAEVAAQQARKDRHAHGNPFFLSCTKRNEHRAVDFTPVSRFCLAELEEAIKMMEEVVQKEDEEIAAGESPELMPSTASTSSDSTGVRTPTDFAAPSRLMRDPVKDLPYPIGYQHYPDVRSQSRQVPQTYVSQLQSAHFPPLPPPPSAQVQALYPSSRPHQLQASLPRIQQQQTSQVHIYPNDNPSGEPDKIPYHPITRVTDSELTEEFFRTLWAKGEPLLVSNVLSKFQIDWSPSYFIEKYGDQSCLVIECQTDLNKRVTVGDFFGDFGKYEGRTERWKLKDWPPSTDFKTAFPELYDDFSRAVPVPNYVRRDGTLNIASHFPSNTISPDLGPKMYNAMASNQAAGSKGSTRLHMDMADAVNIMTYAAATPDGTPGCAAWDLFRSEDSDKLREFLRKCVPLVPSPTDPIHGQQVYLDDELRKRLWEEFGVMSYRVYQRPGEAVFIPAGCAHQVCNLSDCIKVAIDFVSPENVSRCEKLTKEFREQNQSKVWKEDVLQLRSMMWFAWLSCCQQEDLRSAELMSRAVLPGMMV